ncbi:MAG: hypothetical protein HYX68_09205 [Planctomycetes bacterium]|jgi:hypothetical protein|nr:hypothetical protein [Planctomycetota bacterium]
MTAFEDEIDQNWQVFHQQWTSQIASNWAQLKGSSSIFVDSYRRLSSLNALRVYVVEKKLDKDSAAFFLEAHNDALVSHVSASFGAWRGSLQSLRSCVENTLCALYYKDHPIELEQWKTGAHRIGFSDLMAYMERHPALSGVDKTLTGLEMLAQEYSLLSRAVHGSAATFRMTDQINRILLWSTDPARAGMWQTRERHVVNGICLLLIAMFRNEFVGMKLQNVRDTLYYAISATARSKLKTALKISISRP